MKTKKWHKVLGLSLVLLSGLVAATTIAWFTSGTNISFGDETDEIPLQAGAESSYFGPGSGNGTSSSQAFIISERIHLYNLAWLQYMGYFDGTATDRPLQPYFKVTAPIDMSGITLPPIGTIQYPFLGNFDGGGYAISNLTVSNSDPLSNNHDFGVMKPNDTVLAGTQAPEIVGFFGVVGKLPFQSVSYTTSTVALTNIVLSNLIVKSETANTLIGLAAGYVNGSMSGVKLKDNSTIDLGSTGKGVYTYQEGGNTKTITDNLSDFSLVGYSENKALGGNFAQDLSEYYESSGGNAPGAGWGGSVNAKKIMQWLYHMRSNYAEGNIRTGNNTTPKPNEYPSDDNHDYRIGFTTTSANNPETVSSASVVYQMRTDSFMPLIWSESSNQPDDYLSWSSVSSGNTGYIAGMSSTGMRGTPKFASYPIRNIAHSLSNCGFSLRQLYNNITTGGGTNGTIPTSFNESTFNVMTYSKTAINSSNWVWIYDNNSSKTNTKGTDSGTASNNKGKGSTGYGSYPKGNSGTNDTTPNALGLTQYQYKSSTKPGSLYYLKQNLTNASDTFGALFDFASPSNTEYKTLTGPVKVKQNGKTVTYNTNSSNTMNYRIPEGAIDFNLSEDGYINFFASTMYSVISSGDGYAQTNDNFFKFFSLYHVDRTVSGTTSSYNLKEIYKIYRNTDYNSSLDPSSTTNPQYVYSYSSDDSQLSSPGTKGELVFDVYGVLNGTAPVKNAVYYFEFPLNDGEYAMGRASSVGSNESGSYLLYLDIAASGIKGVKDSVTAYSITTKQGGNYYPIGVDFAVVSAGNNGGDSLGASISSSSFGNLSFNVNSAGTNVTITNTSSGSAFAFFGTKYGGSSPPDGTFSVTGTLPSGITGLPPGGTRVLTIDLTKVSGATYLISVTDYLMDQTGAFDENDSIFLVNNQPSSRANVEALSDQIDLEELRGLIKAAELTKTFGSGIFTTTYDTNNCSYSGRTIDVDITFEDPATTVSIAVTSNYTLKISGTEYTSVYP